LEYVTKLVVIAKGASNHLKLNLLDASELPKMPMFKEFSDVFFKKLSVMPPGHDIEFVIELVFGIASMYKTPYRMVAKQLAELKDHIKELLKMGYIRPSSPHWGAPVIFVLEKDGTQ
jgi:hypothetical protein